MIISFRILIWQVDPPGRYIHAYVSNKGRNEYAGRYATLPFLPYTSYEGLNLANQISRKLVVFDRKLEGIHSTTVAKEATRMTKSFYLSHWHGTRSMAHDLQIIKLRTQTNKQDGGTRLGGMHKGVCCKWHLVIDTLDAPSRAYDCGPKTLSLKHHSQNRLWQKEMTYTFHH